VRIGLFIPNSQIDHYQIKSDLYHIINNPNTLMIKKILIDYKVKQSIKVTNITN
jgi:hypothetical protein